MHGFKPPFPNQTAIQFATTLTELVNSHYIEATRTYKYSCFKDYKTLYNSNTIFSLIWITGAITERK